jgi:hypothetical protein
VPGACATAASRFASGVPSPASRRADANQRVTASIAAGSRAGSGDVMRPSDSTWK